MINNSYRELAERYLQRDPADIPVSEQEAIIDCALKYLERRIDRFHLSDSPISGDIVKYLCFGAGREKNSVFALAFLDNRHRLLAFERLFHGGIDDILVYPRVMLQRILQHKAAAVVMVANRPSDIAAPRRSDDLLAKGCMALFSSVDVRLLDYLIVTTTLCFSVMQHKVIS